MATLLLLLFGLAAGQVLQPLVTPTSTPSTTSTTTVTISATAPARQPTATPLPIPAVTPPPPPPVAAGPIPDSGLAWYWVLLIVCAAIFILLLLCCMLYQSRRGDNPYAAVRNPDSKQRMLAGGGDAPPLHLGHATQSPHPYMMQHGGYNGYINGYGGTGAGNGWDGATEAPEQFVYPEAGSPRHNAPPGAAQATLPPLLSGQTAAWGAPPQHSPQLQLQSRSWPRSNASPDGSPRASAPPFPRTDSDSPSPTRKKRPPLGHALSVGKTPEELTASLGFTPKHMRYWLEEQRELEMTEAEASRARKAVSFNDTVDTVVVTED